MRPRPGLLAALLLGLCARAGTAFADGASPTTDASDVGTFAEDLARLDSPYLEDRSRALAALSGRLPAGRAELLAAFRKETGPRRVWLATALGSDDAPETIDALVDAYETDEDLALTRALTHALVQHPDLVGTVLAKRPDDPARSARREALKGLLRRANVERIFLSKKSRSGGTGYYHGQFDDLRVDREFALDVLLAILRDRPADRSGRVPETFSTGSYRWLREPPTLLDRQELRALALNAIDDLVTASDTGVLDGLVGAYGQIVAEAREAYVRNARLRIPRRPLFVAMSERALLDVIAVVLAKNGSADGEALFEDRLRQRNRSILDLEDKAALLLRRKRYDAALEAYEESWRQNGGALTPYNMACAHAMWARDLLETNGVDKAERAEEHKREALKLLQKSVEAGYEDWPWMEQDRDLDAIRDTAEYRRLLARIKARFDDPVEREKGSSSPPPAPGPGSNPPPREPSTSPPPVKPPGAGGPR